MRVIYSVDDFPSDVETAVTIGTFDGVHTGHRKIFEELIKTAKESKLNVPLVVRLAGTNFKEGQKILDESKLKILSASDLNDAAKKIVSAIK